MYLCLKLPVCICIFHCPKTNISISISKSIDICTFPSKGVIVPTQAAARQLKVSACTSLYSCTVVHCLAPYPALHHSCTNAHCLVLHSTSLHTTQWLERLHTLHLSVLHIRALYSTLALHNACSCMQCTTVHCTPVSLHCHLHAIV